MTADPCARFPRSARVRLRAEYSAVFEQGRRHGDPLFALHWAPGPQSPRLGLAVSRKVDPRAVGRNRIKRTLREAFRHLRGRLPGGAYVVVARAGAAQADGAALRDAFERLLQRAGALPPPPPACTMPPANPLPSDDAAPARGPSQPAR